MSKITPGLYLVEVVSADHVPMRSRETASWQASYRVRSAAFHDYRIPADCLHPLPASTISAEAQAVIDTSLSGHRRAVAEHGEYYADDWWEPHMLACRAYLATLPDPVAELMRMAREVASGGVYDADDWDRAISAVEAARGGK
jgi:hypothetical protein